MPQERVLAVVDVDRQTRVVTDGLPATPPASCTTYRLPRKVLYAVSVLQLIAGAVSMVLQIGRDQNGEERGGIGIGAGIWCGFVFILAAAAGFYAVKNPTKAVIFSNLALSIVALSFGIALVVVSSISIVNSSGCRYNNDYLCDYGYSKQSSKSTRCDQNSGAGVTCTNESELTTTRRPTARSNAWPDLNIGLLVTASSAVILAIISFIFYCISLTRPVDVDQHWPTNLLGAMPTAALSAPPQTGHAMPTKEQDAPPKYEDLFGANDVLSDSKIYL